MAKHEPKYGPLSRHLGGATHPVSMTFAEISGLVGGLPPSAYQHRAWWANSLSHVEARAWLDVGLRVEAVDLDRQIVRFSSGQEGVATVTDSTTEYPTPYETRSIEQYPTIGPSLLVHWFIGSVVIEVGGEFGGEWIITDTHVPGRDQGTPTTLRLELR